MIMSILLQPTDIMLIRKTVFFENLDELELAQLLDGATACSYDNDKMLFFAGDPAHRFFVIVEGAVRLFMLNKGGVETIIEVFGSGDAVAAAAIFGPGTYPLNAEALADSRIVSIRSASVLSAIRCNPTLGLRMLASLFQRQLHLMAELRNIRGLTPAQRFVTYLLSLAPSADGPTTVRLPYRKALIAGRLGITPESFSRSLARLTELGVKSKGSLVHIADPARLRRYCQR